MIVSRGNQKINMSSRLPSLSGCASLVPTHTSIPPDKLSCSDCVRLLDLESVVLEGGIGHSEAKLVPRGDVFLSAERQCVVCRCGERDSQHRTIGSQSADPQSTEFAVQRSSPDIQLVQSSPRRHERLYTAASPRGCSRHRERRRASCQIPDRADQPRVSRTHILG